jgi:hypothetical protein
MSTPSIRQVDLILAAGIAAGTAAGDVFTNPLPVKLRIISGYFTPQAAVTANDTNYATVTLANGATTLHSFDTRTSGSGGTGDLVATTPIALTFASGAVGTAMEIAPGAAIKLNKAVTASGVAIYGRYSLYVDEVRV